MSKEKEVRRTSVPLILIFLSVSPLPSSPLCILVFSRPYSSSPTPVTPPPFHLFLPSLPSSNPLPSTSLIFLPIPHHLALFYHSPTSILLPFSFLSPFLLVHFLPSLSLSLNYIPFFLILFSFTYNCNKNNYYSILTYLILRESL